MEKCGKIKEKTINNLFIYHHFNKAPNRWKPNYKLPYIKYLKHEKKNENKFYNKIYIQNMMKGKKEGRRKGEKS